MNNLSNCNKHFLIKLHRLYIVLFNKSSISLKMLIFLEFGVKSEKQMQGLDKTSISIQLMNGEV